MKEKDYWKDYRDRDKTLGICVRCRKHRTIDGKATCEICLEKMHENYASLVKRHTQRT